MNAEKMIGGNNFFILNLINSSKRSSKKCRYCGKYGHSERDCRYRSVSRSNSRSASRSSSGRKKYQKSK